MTKIKNKHYRQFLDEGIITTLTEDDIKAALNNVSGRYTREGRALLICLYYTGARPIEVLNLKAKDIEKVKSYIVVKMPRSKGGLPRTIYLQYKREFVREFWEFARSVFDTMFLFYHFRGRYKRVGVNKEGLVTERIDITDKLRYYMKRWFTGVVEDPISPYFLRHNRFSKLSEKGATDQELKQLKGSKTYTSIEPYRHMSSKSAKSIAKKMD